MVEGEENDEKKPSFQPSGETKDPPEIGTNIMRKKKVSPQQIVTIRPLPSSSTRHVKAQKFFFFFLNSVSFLVGGKRKSRERERKKGKREREVEKRKLKFSLFFFFE